MNLFIEHIYRSRQSTLGKTNQTSPYHHHKDETKENLVKKRIRIKDQVSIDPRQLKLKNV
jgi:hypothetical protein